MKFESVLAALRTIGFHFQKSYKVLILHLCVLYGSHNKWRLLAYIIHRLVLYMLGG